jgi:hypothetical protein
MGALKRKTETQKRKVKLKRAFIFESFRNGLLERTNFRVCHFIRADLRRGLRLLLAFSATKTQ